MTEESPTSFWSTKIPVQLMDEIYSFIDAEIVKEVRESFTPHVIKKLFYSLTRLPTNIDTIDISCLKAPEVLIHYIKLLDCHQ